MQSHIDELYYYDDSTPDSEDRVQCFDKANDLYDTIAYGETSVDDNSGTNREILMQVPSESDR